MISRRGKISLAGTLAAGSLGVLAWVGASAVSGTSLSDRLASTPASQAMAAGMPAANDAHTSSAMQDDSHHGMALAAAARKARVVAAVLSRFHHAKVTNVASGKSGGWTVTLTLRDHRSGTVTVDRHYHVGDFMMFHHRTASTYQAPMTVQAPQPSMAAQPDQAQQPYVAPQPDQVQQPYQAPLYNQTAPVAPPHW